MLRIFKEPTYISDDLISVCLLSYDSNCRSIKLALEKLAKELVENKELVNLPTNPAGSYQGKTLLQRLIEDRQPRFAILSFILINKAKVNSEVLNDTYSHYMQIRNREDAKPTRKYFVELLRLLTYFSIVQNSAVVNLKFLQNSKSKTMQNLHRDAMQFQQLNSGGVFNLQVIWQRCQATLAFFESSDTLVPFSYAICLDMLKSVMPNCDENFNLPASRDEISQFLQYAKAYVKIPTIQAAFPDAGKQIQEIAGKFAIGLPSQQLYIKSNLLSREIDERTSLLVSSTDNSPGSDSNDDDYGMRRRSTGGMKNLS